MNDETMNTSSQILFEELAQFVSGVTIQVDTRITALVITIAPCDPQPRKRKLKIETMCFECSILIAYVPILFLVQNVATVLLDILAFLSVIHQVWGLWKEKRRLGLQGGKGFVTLLLQQGKFTLIKISASVGEDINSFQNVLSTILVCEFTRDLRRRNTVMRSLPNQSALELPDLNQSSQDSLAVRSIQSALGRLQERIIAEMGERSGLVGTDGLNQLEGEPDPETT
ncbi:hypothetical protein Clacol_005816 [Clathrus columnatus]|uniref:Uncharacterized protein n=1 Tax=Clathrus columnatus TaxID=1419009 RepID=A0AAV5AAC3_9AGAM|nr:hypothetical protein Clacol_005816 [Clathrus columnatus]